VAINYADIPISDERVTEARTKPVAASRRVVLRAGFTAASAAALGVFDLINSGVARAAEYFQDWTSTTTGPCGPGNYASDHTENGIKCGPSLLCTDCCWTDADTTTNRAGWHRVGDVASVGYYQRPNQCWNSTYDSWRWKFSDGKTYRCSDGYRHVAAGTLKTICPWAV
jgi:hypothetical protein